jgi:pimeloyl-ACP methyl ester carboxylesterase
MTFFNWIKLGLVVSVAVGATTEQVARHRARQHWAAPGALVDVGGDRKLQLDCRGTGSPTVVLESGLDAYGSLSWALVHDSIAATSRVCAYSRAGLMWSDASKREFDSREAARDLHTALIANGEKGPWVMVGHSIGAAYVTTFTQQYSAEVGGLVLVDPSHPDQFTRYREVTGKSLEPSSSIIQLGAKLRWTGVLRLVPSGESPAPWPAEYDAMAEDLMPTSVKPLADEVGAVRASLAHAGELRAFGDRPLIVLTAGNEQSAAQLKMMSLKPEHGRLLLAATKALHDEQASWSTRGRNEVVAGADHYIQFTRPAAVTSAVREVVGAVAASGR